MSKLILFSFAVIAPTVFGLPVPQFGENTATMGGLTSSITTEHGGFSFAGPPQPNSKTPNNNNSGGDGYQGGETSTIVTVNSVADLLPAYKKAKRHEPEPQPQAFPSWITTFLNSLSNGKSSDTPVGSAALGGLTNTITLGD
ncbi:hypothetical protein E6O75_ATG05898 [Venturia nashicola]|uniref:Uncharacterized protein n=1 Tax=Venturia nashicola TaxID=86259 RepID=A0A4Z1NVW9_9PEZI|nr:hypothetical protein E6O75_ATG05898 [Venturia nashicola]